MKAAPPDSEYGDAVDKSVSWTGRPVEVRGRKAGAAPLEEIQARAIELFAQGLSNAQVCQKIDRSPQTYQLWRTTTPGFAEKVDRVRARAKGEDTRKEVGDFGEWRQEYMHMETFWHQWQWVDLLQGKEPRDLHPTQIYREGIDKENILVNTPPNHAKSTTITMDYVTYLICRDPSIRVIIISESAGSAKRLMLGIKRRLTHPDYADLIRDFGPGPLGFRDPEQPWNESEFYVYGNDAGEKDPTVRATGINGQIYGSRADLIILDDCVSLKTSRTKGGRERMMDWIRSEAMSRLEPVTGRLLIVGTRLSPDDLYGQIVREDERGFWTYLTQPAVLEWGEREEDHVTLWPYRFPAKEINKIIGRHGQDMARFRLVYQQEAAPEDAVFPEPAIIASTYPGGCGFVPENVRSGGMAGLYVVAGLDPAASGHTAIVILGVDKRTKMRYLIDCMNQRAIKPHDLRAKMVEFTRKYKINEWRIEKNGLQTLISQDSVLRTELLGLSARVVEHHTMEYGKQGKWDPDYGVASMAPLFLGALEQPRANLITMGYNGTHRATRELRDQLISWEPGTVGKTDLVMALWFAELGCRKQLQVGQQTHAPNRWASKGRLQQRHVINIQEYLDAQAAS